MVEWKTKFILKVHTQKLTYKSNKTVSMVQIAYVIYTLLRYSNTTGHLIQQHANQTNKRIISDEYNNFGQV